jgi:hypothetical protein
MIRAACKKSVAGNGLVYMIIGLFGAFFKDFLAHTPNPPLSPCRQREYGRDEMTGAPTAAITSGAGWIHRILSRAIRGCGHP